MAVYFTVSFSFSTAFEHRQLERVGGVQFIPPGLFGQEHGLNVFVVAVNWLVTKLNYSFTCR